MSTMSTMPPSASTSSLSAPSPTKPLTLLDLTPDLLDAIAFHLPPPSRLALACTSKAAYASVWGHHASTDLILRFPIERRTEFSLTVYLTDANSTTPTTTPSPFRTVPSRSRQQHLNVAVTPCGSLVAVLPYDNILRLICPNRCAIVASCDIPVFSNDVWDVQKGFRKPQTRPPAVVYADDAGLDIETCLEFTSDGTGLVIASRDAVRFFAVGGGGGTASSSNREQSGHNNHPTNQDFDDGYHRARHSMSRRATPTLTLQWQLPITDALARIAPTAHGTGGAANLSPDGNRLAWIVFEGTPATAYATIWRRRRQQHQHHTTPAAAANDAQQPQHDWEHERTIAIGRVWTRRWASLAWARPLFTPNSRFLALVLNCAHKETRIVNIDGHYHRTKLCRFELMRVDFGHGHATSHARDAVATRRTEWLDLAPDVYPKLLAEAVERVLDAAVVHRAGGRFGRVCTDGGGEGRGIVSAREVFRHPGLAFNSVHSCPAEATYKSLSFGKAKHPWFVSKQPMFSFHFSPSGSRVVLATSPHCNIMRTLVGRRAADATSDTVTAATVAAVAAADVNNSYNSMADGDANGNVDGLASEGGDVDVGMGVDGVAEDGDEGELQTLVDEDLEGRRRMAFKMMPWRAAFAAITAFSTSGQWLAGAALLDEDRCCVCVRNVTLREYFGEQDGE